MMQNIESRITGQKLSETQTLTNYGPRAKSSPPVLLFWPAGTYANLNSHPEFIERSFFSVEIIIGSDFQKISLIGAKLE